VNLFVSFAGMEKLHLQILPWSVLFFEQYWGYELRKKGLENTMNVHKIRKGGTFFFKVMIDVIPSYPEETICALNSKF